MRADIMLEKGDLDERRVWLRVLKAIEELMDKGPSPDGVAVH